MESLGGQTRGPSQLDLCADQACYCAALPHIPLVPSCVLQLLDPHFRLHGSSAKHISPMTLLHPHVQYSISLDPCDPVALQSCPCLPMPSEGLVKCMGMADLPLNALPSAPAWPAALPVPECHCSSSVLPPGPPARGVRPWPCAWHPHTRTENHPVGAQAQHAQPG